MSIHIPWKKFPILAKLILGLSASVVLLLFSIGYSYYVSNRLYKNNALIEHTDSLINRLDIIDLKLADCESSVRAYAMSNAYSFLYNYDKSRKITRQYLQSLEKLTEDHPEQSAKIRQLHGLYKERFKLLEQAIAIEKGEIPDKKGLKNRNAMAIELRRKIQEVATDLKGMLRNSLETTKKESAVLLNNNKTANRAAILLGGILAGLLGLVVFKDVREREKTERELRILNQQKNQFFSIMSHDLRGPTRNTSLLLEMMKDTQYVSSPEEAEKVTGLALESARQTQKLVEDLLTWGRLQMDQVAVVPTQFCPHEAVEKVYRALQPAASIKNISLENNIPRNLLIQADNNMVETVIRNLVSNGIKYTPAGGKLKSIAQQSGEFVELMFEDSGVGMTPQAMEKIFSFHTKHTTKGTAGEPGTGLGLAFCKEFIERNGGMIGVESQIGIGSKFNVRLPAPQLVNQN